MKKYRIGYTQGTYDVVHLEHLNLLNRIKVQCDYLIVGVHSDRLVQQYKDEMPVMSETERYEIISNIKVVDKVIIVNDLTGSGILSNIHLDAVFVPHAWEKELFWRDVQRYLGKCNVDIVFLPNIETNNVALYEKGFKIGYTTGTFDMFHIGHLHILQKAKKQCDYLIVGVSTDELVQSYKNKLPVIPFVDRVEIIKSTRFADEVIPQGDRDKIAAYKRLHFDVMFVGDDWKGSELFNEVEKYLKDHGVEVVYFPYTQRISSSMLRTKIGL